MKIQTEDPVKAQMYQSDSEGWPLAVILKLEIELMSF